jgi:hypothetical protein
MQCCHHRVCSYEAIRSVGRFIFGKYAKANAPKLPLGLSRTLVHVVDSDTDTDNRVCAMNCLNCMAIHAPSSLLTNSEAVACALRVVQEQGTGARPIPPFLPAFPAAAYSVLLLGLSFLHSLLFSFLFLPLSLCRYHCMG